jgi:4-hydroxy-tetrahydrodipicolinate reductase
MKIALIGYGTMGQAVEEIALLRGHSAGLRADKYNSFTPDDLRAFDVAVEFTEPDSAVENIHKCFEAGIPVVCGTTGWYQHLPAVKEECIRRGNALFYASNFSLGVNMLFHINERLAQLMNSYSDYSPRIDETHHIRKKDAPSGTAITLAEGILENIDRLHAWTSGETDDSDKLPVISHRINDVPGVHEIVYESDTDMLSLRHEAKNRKGFAYGAVLAAEWITNKKGVFTMRNLLQL